jgi:hypothetical protein
LPHTRLTFSHSPTRLFGLLRKRGCLSRSTHFRERCALLYSSGTSRTMLSTLGISMPSPYAAPHYNCQL